MNKSVLSISTFVCFLSASAFAAGGCPNGNEIHIVQDASGAFGLYLPKGFTFVHDTVRISQTGPVRFEGVDVRVLKEFQQPVKGPFRHVLALSKFECTYTVNGGVGGTFYISKDDSNHEFFDFGSDWVFKPSSYGSDASCYSAGNPATDCWFALSQ